MRFVNPEVEEFEPEQGFVRYGIDLVDRRTGQESSEVAYLPIGLTYDAIVEAVVERELEWIEIYQLDGTPEKVSKLT